MAFSLNIDEGRYGGRRYVFDQDEVTLGRTAENDIVVPDAAASRKHARISVEGERHLVEDLQSSNGTRVNGEPLTRRIELRDGELVQIGELTFRFQAHDEAPNSTRIVSVGDLPQWDKAPPPGAIAKARPGAVAARPGAAPMARRPAPGPLSRIRERVRELPKPMRITVFAAGGLLALSLVLSLVARLTSAGAAGPAVQDQLFELGSAPDRQVYGDGPGVDVTTPAKARFEFNFSEPVPGKSLLTLHCQVDLVGRPEDVEVRINGRHLAYLSATFGESHELDWTLDRRLLKPNDENLVEFVNLRHPPTNWEVSRLWLEQESLPSGTPAELTRQAQQEFDLAQSKLESEQVYASNLHDAWIHYKRARLILAAIPVPPANLSNLVHERLKEVTIRLDKRCHQMLFTAKQALITKGGAAAMDALNDIVAHFPTNDHPCYEKARSWMAKLE